MLPSREPSPQIRVWQRRLIDKLSLSYDDPLIPFGVFTRVSAWLSMKASRILAAVLFISLTFAGRAHAMHPDEYVPPGHWNGNAVVLPTAIFRNGDWFAVGAVGILALSPRADGGFVVATSRAEVGVAGANVAR